MTADREERYGAYPVKTRQAGAVPGSSPQRSPPLRLEVPQDRPVAPGDGEESDRSQTTAEATDCYALERRRGLQQEGRTRASTTLQIFQYFLCSENPPTQRQKLPNSWRPVFQN